MPNWKKVIISGSNAELNNLFVTNDVTSSGLLVNGTPQFNTGASSFTFTNYNLTYGSSLNINSNNGGYISIKPAANLELWSNSSKVITFNMSNSTGNSIIQQTHLNRSQTNVLASTEVPTIYYTGNNKTWQSGNITTQRFFHITGNTASFAGASTITDAYGLYVQQTLAGTNATITNNYAIGAEGAISASTFYGDGSNLSGISPFPYTGDAQITGSLIISSSTSTPTQFKVGNSTLFVSSSGNVGIGTITPSTKLHVVGTISGSALNTSGNTEVNGRISVGKTSPTVNIDAYHVSDNVIGRFTSGDAGSYLEFKDSNTTANFKVLNGAIGDDFVAWAGGSERFRIKDSGNVGIGTTSPSTKLQVVGNISGSNLNIAGSGSFAGKIQSQGFLFGSNIIGSLGATNRYISDGGDAQDFWFNVPTSGRYRFAVNNSVIGSFDTTGVFSSNGLNITGNANINGNTTMTGSLIISSSTSSPLTVYGSGSTLFEIIGSVGSVFSIDDSLSGSLMVVSDISGIPQFEVFSDGKITLGSTPESLYTTAQIASTATTTNQAVYTISTSSYDGAWFDYTVISGSNMRAGSVMSIWEAGAASIVYTETTTKDIGDTTGVSISAVLTGSEAALQINTTTPKWKIKTIVRSI